MVKAAPNAEPPKKKLSKKAAEQKRREEEERISLEEIERNRIEFERERIAVCEERRVTILKEARLAALERERIRQEDVKLTPEWTPKLTQAYNNRFLELAAKKEWREFVQCSELPDPENESEINSYLTLWRDQSASNAENSEDNTQDRNVEQDFKDCNIAISLYHQIEGAMFSAINRGQPDREKIHRENMDKIAHAIIDTLDDMTAYIMQFSDVYIDDQTDEYIKMTDAVDYGLWVNIAKNARKKSVQFNDINAVCELALKGMALQKIAIRILQLKNYDPLTITSKVHSLLIPIGGITYIDILHIPPPPSAYNGWTIRKLTSLSKRVKRKAYEQLDAQGIPTDPPSTRVSFIISPHVLIRKEVPNVAWWDDNTKAWSTEGFEIEKTKYNPEKRKITFYTTHLTTALAVVHEKIFDLPYRSWLLQPTPKFGRNSALYMIRTKEHESPLAQIDDIVIFVFNDVCKLLSPTRPELEHLTSSWLEPRVLLQRLAESGINLVVQDEDSQFTDRIPKNADVEQKAYTEIAWLANISAFTSSKWNQDLKVGEDKSVLRMSTTFLDPLDSDLVEQAPVDITLADVIKEGYLSETYEWRNVAYWNFKTSFINCADMDDFVNLETIPDHNTHLNLGLCIDEDDSSLSILNRIEQSDLLTCESIRILLSATRPLSWC